MSHAEFVRWMKYREKWGPLNPARRFDRGAAQVSAIACGLMGNKVEMRDLMTWPFRTEEEQEADDVLRELGF